MSFQLIHTSREIDPSTGKLIGGEVLCSPDMPEGMPEVVEEHSKFRLPADCGILGPQYSYIPIVWNRGHFHLLSTVRRVADPPGKGHVYLAQHLILTEKEAAAMHSNAARPTPAGIILSLEHKGFWYAKAEIAPESLTREPKLTAADLPPANRQQTWKRLTGHKRNARAFLAPAYENACLVLVPPPCSGADILMLYHESDWLTSARGWGRAFTTYAGAGDEHAGLRRMALAGNSAFLEQETWQRFPRLSIHRNMKIEEPVETARKNSLRSESEERAIPLPKSTLSSYYYVETPDEDVFDVAPQRLSPLTRWMIYIASLLVLAAVVHTLVAHSVEDAGAAAGDLIRKTGGTNDNVAAISDTKLLSCVMTGGRIEKELREWMRLADRADIYPTVTSHIHEYGKVSCVSGSQEGELLFTVDNGNGGRYRLHIDIRGGRLNDVRVNGERAIVALSTVDNRRQWQTILLVPKLRIPLTTGDASLPESVPGIEAGDILLQEGHLDLSDGYPHLQGKKHNAKSGYPALWLPALNGHNNKLKDGSENGSVLQQTYDWSSHIIGNVYTPMEKEGYCTEIYEIELMQENPAAAYARSCFRVVVEEPLDIAPRGEPITLTHLALLARQMQETGAKALPAYHTVYGRLKSHPAFRGNPLPPPAPGNAANTAVCRELAGQITRCVCRVINAQIAERYETLKRRNREGSKSIYLVLHQIRLEKGGDIDWLFALEEGEEETP